MIFGIPDRFAFLIEKVPEWSDKTFTNGLLYVFVNFGMFPKELRNTTLSSELYMLFDSPPPIDERLYALPDNELFEEFRRLRFPARYSDNEDADEEYRFELELHELGDAGYHIFAVSDGENVRVHVGYWVDSDNFEFVNSAEITLEEYTELFNELSEYYYKEICNGGQHG